MAAVAPQFPHLDAFFRAWDAQQPFDAWTPGVDADALLADLVGVLASDDTPLLHRATSLSFLDKLCLHLRPLGDVLPLRAIVLAVLRSGRAVPDAEAGTQRMWFHICDAFVMRDDVEALVAMGSCPSCRPWLRATPDVVWEVRSLAALDALVAAGVDLHGLCGALRVSTLHYCKWTAIPHLLERGVDPYAPSACAPDLLPIDGQVDAAATWAAWVVQYPAGTGAASQTPSGLHAVLALARRTVVPVRLATRKRARDLVTWLIKAVTDRPYEPALVDALRVAMDLYVCVCDGDWLRRRHALAGAGAGAA